MSEVIAIAVGGALGALSRFWATNLANILFGTDFPYGILIVNIAGSFAIGIVFILLVERSLLPTFWGAGLMVGFLGAFTTFSTFSLQALGLLESGRFFAAAIYIAGSVIVCIFAAALGMFIARLIP
jgi:CrcB protein